MRRVADKGKWLSGYYSSEPQGFRVVMTDTVDKQTRSRMMAGIKGRNTRPERLLRQLLHRSGFRFRLHPRQLPGRPDIVLPKYRTAIFVHGCFWHRHHGCHYTSTPSTRPEFWAEKFSKNIERDGRNCRQLQESDWRVLIVWECGLKHDPENSLRESIKFLKADQLTFAEVPIQPPRQ